MKAVSGTRKRHQGTKRIVLILSVMSQLVLLQALVLSYSHLPPGLPNIIVLVLKEPTDNTVRKTNIGRATSALRLSPIFLR